MFHTRKLRWPEVSRAGVVLVCIPTTGTSQGDDLVSEGMASGRVIRIVVIQAVAVVFGLR